MNKHNKFIEFVESICDDTDLLKHIKYGYKACMESIIEQIQDNIWQFDSDGKKLNFSPEIAKKYFNVMQIIKDNKLQNITDDDIQISIRGNAEIIDSTLVKINELFLILWISGQEMNILEITIPEVLIPSESHGDNSMLSTSVKNLITQLIEGV